MRRGNINQGAKKYGETTFTNAVKLPVESACTGISASIIFTWSSVAIVLVIDVFTILLLLLLFLTICQKFFLF